MHVCAALVVSVDGNSRIIISASFRVKYVSSGTWPLKNCNFFHPAAVVTANRTRAKLILVWWFFFSTFNFITVSDKPTHYNNNTDVNLRRGFFFIIQPYLPQNHDWHYIYIYIYNVPIIIFIITIIVLLELHLHI